MAKYRKVDVRIWNDAKFVGLSECGKLVFMFLMTHPNLTVVGAMRATAPGLAAELNMPMERFREGFQEGLSRGMVKVDPKACLVWLPNFLKYNRPDNPNVVKSWADAFDLLPECHLKDLITQHSGEFVKGLGEGFAKAFRDSIANGYGNGMPNQEQEQEQEQEQKKDNASGDAPPSRPEMFPDAWNRLSGPLPKVREFTEDRKRKVKARITQGLTLATFEEAVQKCTLTPFLSGVNDRAWKADFDWLVSNGTHVTAVLEGKYDSSSASPAPSGIPRPPTREEQVERQSAEDDEERRAWEIWCSMSPAHKAVNPWQGRKFGEEREAVA